MALAAQMFVADRILPDCPYTIIRPTVTSDSLIEVAFQDRAYKDKFPIRKDENKFMGGRLKMCGIGLENGREKWGEESPEGSFFDFSSIEQWPWEAEEITADFKGYMGVMTYSNHSKSVPYFLLRKNGESVTIAFSEFIVLLIDHCVSKVYSEMQTLCLLMAKVFAIMRQGEILAIIDPELRELCFSAAIMDAQFVEFTFQDHRSIISVDMKNRLIKYEFTKAQFQSDKLRRSLEKLKKHSSSSWYRRGTVEFSLDLKSDIKEFHQIVCDMRSLVRKTSQHLTRFIRESFELKDLL